MTRSGAVYYLKPSNDESAEFGIHYYGCVDVFFGKFGTTFEIDFGHGSPNADFAAASAFAEKLGRAVIAGKCKERAGFTGIRGAIEVGDTPYRTTHFFYFRLFPKQYATLHIVSRPRTGKWKHLPASYNPL